MQHGPRVCCEQVCKKYLVNGKDVFWTFLHLEKAHDTTDRNGMWHMLRVYGGKLLKALQNFYVDSKASVSLGMDASEWVMVNVRWRRGCVMSPWLFNVYMDGVVREENTSLLG